MFDVISAKSEINTAVHTVLDPYTAKLNEEIRRLCDKYSLEYVTGMGTWFFDSMKRKGRRYDTTELEYLMIHAPSDEYCRDLRYMCSILDQQVGDLDFEWYSLTSSYKPERYK